MPLPEFYLRAIAPVLKDIGATTECDVGIVERLTGPLSRWDAAQDVAIGGGVATCAAFITNAAATSGRRLLLQDEDLSHWIFFAADAVQEFVIEECNNTWPPCPTHPNHPLWAAFVDDQAVWRCPSDPTLTVPIGELV